LAVNFCDLLVDGDWNLGGGETWGFWWSGGRAVTAWAIDSEGSLLRAWFGGAPNRIRKHCVIDRRMRRDWSIVVLPSSHVRRPGPRLKLEIQPGSTLILFFDLASEKLLSD
jgi:hypothetical protein